MIRRVHLIGQWFFLRVEGLFNLAFGDRLNPLYYLGPISYYLMWLVVASGLYLYVFFETSVTGAFDSVEALTHGQRWAGGILRSVHRYASDGVVVTMLLHMARHWSFDRYRGFRWFSWVSGAAVLALVYVSGINGYMLPWDRLSQFVVVATAEWFDWLPLFNGALVRNFIFVENVNDRLFSLLSFVHIGAPLAVLAVLWVHTQRVPQARTAPPLPIALTLTGALVVLSLVKPALSQPRADLAAAATAIEFDWFYLPVYALLYRWTPGEVWLLVAGAGLVFVLAPWLPPRRKAEGHFMLARPDNRIIALRPGETLLDAGLREGLAMPFECRNGGCGKCKCTLASGAVDYGAYQREALSDADIASATYYTTPLHLQPALRFLGVEDRLVRYGAAPGLQRQGEPHDAATDDRDSRAALPRHARRRSHRSSGDDDEPQPDVEAHAGAQGRGGAGAGCAPVAAA